MFSPEFSKIYFLWTKIWMFRLEYVYELLRRNIFSEVSLKCLRYIIKKHLQLFVIVKWTFLKGNNLEEIRYREPIQKKFVHWCTRKFLEACTSAYIKKQAFVKRCAEKRLVIGLKFNMVINFKNYDLKFC